MNPSVLHGALSQAFALVAAVVAVFGLVWLARRLQARVPGARTPLRIVGGTAVGTRERVVVLEVGSTWLVVGVAPGRVNAIATLPKLEPEAVAPASEDETRGFSAWLSRTLERRTPT
jgi:flagellar protein FliO/FliZ